MKAHIKDEMKPLAEALKQLPTPDHVVATSKTFRSLARLAGQLVAVVGPTERRRMSRSDLEDWVGRLAQMPAAARTALPGITPERTYQIVAGAEVAVRAMKSFKVSNSRSAPGRCARARSSTTWRGSATPDQVARYGSSQQTWLSLFNQFVSPGKN